MLGGSKRQPDAIVPYPDWELSGNGTGNPCGKATGEHRYFGLLLVALIFASTTGAAEPEWQPGIIGGIPNIPRVNSVVDFGATGDGVTDDSGAFAAALSALPAGGGAVFVPPGTYFLRSTIEIGDGAVLRGAGAASSHLVFDLAGREEHSIEVLTYERGDWFAVLSGHVEGSTHITVSDASDFEITTFAEIEQENDPEIMYTDPRWDQYFAQYAVGEIVRVVGKNENQLLLEEPLHFSYDPAMNPRIRTQGFVEYAGIEDLHIKRLDDGYGGMILLKNAAQVWIRGVESELASTFHVGVYTVYRCEVRQSYFHHAQDYGGGGYGYGVSLDRHTAGCLTEDNIFEHLRHSMILTIGANGNVFGYNYSRDPVWPEFGSPPDISFHGFYSFRNLAEGNVAQEIAVSDFWGPVGPGNTILRNCVQFENLAVFDHSHGQNIIGNALGENVDIYLHPSVLQTFVHGNFVDGAVQWDPAVPDHTIPLSLYLSSKPQFFGDLGWPAIGGDMGYVCANPALARWESGEPTPNRTYPLVFSDGFESGNVDVWSYIVQ